MDKPDRVWIDTDDRGQTYSRGELCNKNVGEYLNDSIAIEKARIFSCEKCGDSGELHDLGNWNKIKPPTARPPQKPCPCTTNPYSIHSIKNKAIKK